MNSKIVPTTVLIRHQSRTRTTPEYYSSHHDTDTSKQALQMPTTPSPPPSPSQYPSRFCAKWWPPTLVRRSSSRRKAHFCLVTLARAAGYRHARHALRLSRGGPERRNALVAAPALLTVPFPNCAWILATHCLNSGWGGRGGDLLGNRKRGCRRSVFLSAFTQMYLLPTTKKNLCKTYQYTLYP